MSHLWFLVCLRVLYFITFRENKPSTSRIWLAKTAQLNNKEQDFTKENILPINPLSRDKHGKKEISLLDVKKIQVERKVYSTETSKTD